MRTPTPASVLRDLAAECRRQGDAVFLESDRLMEAATRLYGRERELLELAEDQEQAGKARAYLGENVVALRRRAG
jgi:hypothetical protein